MTMPTLVEYGICPSLKCDVNDFVFMANNDAGSNMVKAWEEFNGSTCAGHKLGRATSSFLASEGIRLIVKKVKGMAAHYHRSTKGLSVLHGIQKRLGLAETKPPPGNATRAWNGFFEMARWFMHNADVVSMYDDEHPNDCADNPDGSKYKDHAFDDPDQWELLREVVGYVLFVMVEIFT